MDNEQALVTSKRQLFERCGRDEKINRFDEQFASWTKSLSEDILRIMPSLLSKFEYYTHARVNECLEILYQKLVVDEGVEPDNILVTFLKKKDGQSNSSVEYYCDFKRINNINKQCCSTDLDQISKEDWANIQNVVIVDDVCGTGESLESFLNNEKVVFRHKKIYYLTVHFMKDALRRMNEIEKKLQVTIIPLYCVLQSKASECIKNIASDNILDSIRKFSADKGIPSKWTLGFKQTQALAAFYNNTPNNTLGLFWHSTGQYQAPFPREESLPPPWKKRPSVGKMASDKNARRSKNYNAKARGKQL